jgi:sarcosine oxidase subunit beta
MAETADVIIIGGGCNGASIAYHLTQRGVKDVVLLEKNFLASGPTGRSSAIVRQHYSNEETAKMALKSLRVFQNFSEVVGGTCDFVNTGFMVGATEQDLDALKGNVALQQSVGINTRVVYRDEINQLDPNLFTEDIVAAAYEPEGGYCDPASTTTSFAARAKDAGARILQGTEVTDILIEKGKVRGVVTTKGEFHAPVVVNAAGAWGRRVAQMVGIDVPLEPSRHEIAAFRRPPDFGKPPVVYGDFIRKTYMRSEGKDLILIGSLDPKDAENIVDPDHYNEGIEWRSVESFTAHLLHRYPAMERGFSKGGWAGVYDVTPDWHPIMDEVPDAQGCYLCVGFSGHGFKLCPATGDLMAEFITTGKTTEVDIRFFRLSRFAEGQPIRGKYSYSILG